MAFFTIFAAPGLTASEYRRALRSGPTFASTRRRDHGELLASAGFRHTEETDLTAEFLLTSRAWENERRKRAAGIIAAEGEAAFEERQSDLDVQSRAIEAGLLRRSLFVCS
ncbi:MAG TPA: hypothetical protein VIW01_08635 [Dehalococcoidia bacterium]